MYFPDGTYYNGEWADGMKHGNGIQLMKNGDIYEGKFHENKRHG